MQRRKFFFLLAASVAALIWIGQPIFSGIFFEPLQNRNAQLIRLQGEITKKKLERKQVMLMAAQLQSWKNRSLPPDALDAQRLYQSWLRQLAEEAGFSELKVNPNQTPRQGKAFASVQVTVQGEAKLGQLNEFLLRFYQTDLMHRIVSLTMNPKKNLGDPLIAITLTAEGLAFPNSAERQRLFAETTLSEEFDSKTEQQPIKVADAAGFPKKAGFRVKIGQEFLTVTKLDGKNWTVKGGIDSTSPAQHSSSDTLTLARVHPDFGDRNLTADDYGKIAQQNPFVKPAPPPTRQASGPPPHDEAKETYLSGIVKKDGVWEAWLNRESPPGQTIQTIVKKGEKITVADINATVLDIEHDFIVLSNGEKTYRLEAGKDLRSWVLVEAPPTDQPPANAAKVTPTENGNAAKDGQDRQNAKQQSQDTDR